VLAERLQMADCQPERVQAVLITHEHSDHILGLPSLMKRYHVSAFADPRTLAEIRAIFAAGTLRTETGTLLNLDMQTDLSSGERTSSLARKGGEPVAPTSICPSDNELWRALPVGTRCVIGDIEVHAFPVSHDAVAPCGYMLSAGGCRVCLVTDSGEVTPVMLEAIARADLLILEANHDRARLLSGPYPYHLKQRILSPTGHLSNAQAAEAVLRTWRSDTVRWLWLAHLSRTNNTPNLALSSLQKKLREAGANLAQIHISVLRHSIGGSWDSTRLWHDTHLWELP
jgi:phosphoribosyl 1,2-cyclic phosphodiesterase